MSRARNLSTPPLPQARGLAHRLSAVVHSGWSSVTNRRAMVVALIAVVGLGWLAIGHWIRGS
jgi:hypothetical protein